MKLTLVRHLWGVELPWKQAFTRLSAEGFTAVESPLPEPEKRDEWVGLLEEFDLRYVAMAFTSGSTPAEHAESFRKQLQSAIDLNALQLTCHSGSDAWSSAQANDYFKAVMEVEQSAGIAVGHETHRGRLLFNPWQARDLMEAFPRLRLCCDYSHWVCVAERLLGDCGPILKLAADRCVHVHARVGYEEGPQVPDPSAAEYATHLAAHESWWDMIWASQKQRGMSHSTLTPEFGPPGYLHTLPHTNVPVADLWTLCRWIAHRQRERFAQPLAG